MKSVITGPGLYTSKAGKCEVTDIRGFIAIGWFNNNGFQDACVWDTRTGLEHMYDQRQITSIWTDKPKPIEGTAWVFPNGHFRKVLELDDHAECERVGGRLVHLIEAEEAVGGWPKLKAAEVARRMAAEDRG